MNKFIVSFYTALLLFALATTVHAQYFGDYIPERTGVVIFVHGLTGSSDTWKNPNGAFWPDLLRRDPKLRNTNIYIVEYPTQMLGAEQLGIDELSTYIHQDLSAHHVLDHQSLAFVAHSMGGIITRQLLIKYPERIGKKVSFLYFFGTPSLGSDLAKLDWIPNRSMQLEQLKKVVRGDSSILRTTTNQWLSNDVLRGIPSYTAYETKVLQKCFLGIFCVGTLVVEEPSACHLGTRPPLALPFDHVNMVKPSDTESIIYQTFINALEENLYGVPCSSFQNDHPIINLGKDLLNQLRLLPEDEVEVNANSQYVSIEGINYNGRFWPIRNNKFVVQGVPGKPVNLGKFVIRGTKNEYDSNWFDRYPELLNAKLSITYCRYNRINRDLNYDALQLAPAPAP